MIAAKFRFHGYGGLKYVHSQGKTVRTKLCGLRFAANERQKNIRVAVVVSKKVHKSAVLRNRIRRRVYEAVRSHQDQITQPFDMVFVVFNEQLATIPAGELQAMVAELLQKAGITTN